jgi:hypothetical protein
VAHAYLSSPLPLITNGCPFTADMEQARRAAFQRSNDAKRHCSHPFQHVAPTGQCAEPVLPTSASAVPTHGSPQPGRHATTLALSDIATAADDFDTDAVNFDKINVDTFLEGYHPSLLRIPPPPSLTLSPPPQK